MELSRIQFMAMNSPVKKMMDRYQNLRIYKEMFARNGIDLDGKVILDAGCGSGYNLKLISETWQPKEIHGFDYMPGMVKLAKKKGLTANLFVGDITAIDLPSDKFDVVFVVGVFHHVPEWHTALEEVNRIMKTGGVLVSMELNKRFLDLTGRIPGLGHPVESRFEWPEFTDALGQAGFHILEYGNLIPFTEFARTHLCSKDSPCLSLEKQLEISASVKG